MHHPTDRIAHTTTFGTPAGTRNSSMGPPWRIDPTTHRTMSKRSLAPTDLDTESCWTIFHLLCKCFWMSGFKPWMFQVQSLLMIMLCQVRSGQSVSRAHSEQAVVAHACHGHRHPLPWVDYVEPPSDNWTLDLCLVLRSLSALGDIGDICLLGRHPREGRRWKEGRKEGRKCFI